jgi:hypothetical protein
MQFSEAALQSEKCSFFHYLKKMHFSEVKAHDVDQVKRGQQQPDLPRHL